MNFIALAIVYPTYRRILTLAWPIILSHMGHMMASIADSIMAGQLGKIPLAAVGLSVTIYAIVALFGIGLVSGITPLVAKADGQQNEKEKESLYKHSLIMSFIAGIVLCGIMMAIIPFLDKMGQPPEVIEEAIPYYIAIASSVPFSLMFFHYKQFGEGIHIVKTTMWINIWGNLLNIFLNFLFLKGWFGLPELGSFGIGLGTVTSRIIMLIAMIYQFRKSGMRPYMDAFSNVKYESKKLRNLFADCLPIAFQYIIEMSAFSVGAIMSGWFGASSLASHQIAINIVSTTYLIAAGLGAASSIIVGNGHGEKSLKKIKMATIMSAKICIAIMLVLTVVMILARKVLPSLYIDDIEVIKLSSTLLIVAAVFQLFDGLQVVGLGVLRGINDLKTPTYISAFSYWIVTVPLSYYLSTVLEYKTIGIWYGFLAGLTISAALIFLRIRNRMKMEEKLFS